MDAPLYDSLRTCGVFVTFSTGSGACFYSENKLVVI
jgi:hypothetical protein